MMAEGDGEVKREAVEAGAGGRPTGTQEPAGEEVAQQGPASAELQAGKYKRVPPLDSASALAVCAFLFSISLALSQSGRYSSCQSQGGTFNLLCVIRVPVARAH